MRVQSLGNAAACAVVVSGLLCVALNSGSADVGGGKGHPATPWHSAPKSVQEIEKAKSVAAEYRNLFVSEKSGSNEMDLLQMVSLRPEKRRKGDKDGYALVGKSGSGEMVTLSFSQIASFIVISKNPKTIVLSVTVWPDISPKELFDKQPTYKQLAAGYRRTVILEMSLKSADGRYLGFAAERGEATLPLKTLNVGTKGDFYRGSVPTNQFWWAIPSVANDADYPYRIILKR